MSGLPLQTDSARKTESVYPPAGRAGSSLCGSFRSRKTRSFERPSGSVKSLTARRAEPRYTDGAEVRRVEWTGAR